MSSTTQYEIGDVVNGHRWTGTEWQPVWLEAQAAPQNPNVPPMSPDGQWVWNGHSWAPRVATVGGKAKHPRRTRKLIAIAALAVTVVGVSAVILPSGANSAVTASAPSEAEKQAKKNARAAEIRNEYQRAVADVGFAWDHATEAAKNGDVKEFRKEGDRLIYNSEAAMSLPKYPGSKKLNRHWEAGMTECARAGYAIRDRVDIRAASAHMQKCRTEMVWVSNLAYELRMDQDIRASTAG